MVARCRCSPNSMRRNRRHHATAARAIVEPGVDRRATRGGGAFDVFRRAGEIEIDLKTAVTSASAISSGRWRCCAARRSASTVDHADATTTGWCRGRNRAPQTPAGEQREPEEPPHDRAAAPLLLQEHVVRRIGRAAGMRRPGRTRPRATPPDGVDALHRGDAARARRCRASTSPRA